MHDLRHDQEEAAAATVPAHALDPADLRTVPMPDLRSAEARTLDAAQRALDTRTYAERTDARLARIESALERIADAVMIMALERQAAQERHINGYE